jgi:hypothetical protein
MTKHIYLKMILIVAIILILVACGSNSDDVPSLAATPTPEVMEEILDDEAKVMAFVQCMREEGIEYKDPVVDSDGNVQQPEFIEGFTAGREELAEPYAACFHHIEGLIFGRERGDITEQLDEFLELATCLREAGYDMDDPTAETLETWLIDFRMEYEWDDPQAMEAYEECTAEEEGN